MGWVLDLLRSILGLLDRLVYLLIELFYSTLIKIANVNVFSNETLEIFATRIYAFIAIIMVFKVTFSVINYIVNPDNFSNGEKGVGKLIQNIVLVLVLIVAVPRIFEQAIKLQQIVLNENIVGKIILGTGGTAADSKNSHSVLSENDDTYKVMSYSVLKAFLDLDYRLSILDQSDNGTPMCGGALRKIPEPVNGKIELSSTDGDPFRRCLDDMSSYVATIYDETDKTYKTMKLGEAYVYSEITSDYMGLINMVNAKWDYASGENKEQRSEYVLHYIPIISTLAGGFIVWVLMIFCFDIAIRTVKLGFLQLIAPIPVISYIDPKSGKSGMFQKWVKTSLKTYADLFIRLAAIFFAIYIIKILPSDMTYAGTKTAPGPIIKVFIILGALMFAKQLPKLIEDLTGINLSGKFELNPMKKLGASPFAAAAIGGIGAGIGGFGANLANSIIQNKGQGAAGFFRGMRSTVAGTASGFVRGNIAGLTGKGDGNAWKAVTTGLKGSNDARNLRAKRVANDDGGPKGFFRRRGVDLQNAAGIASGVSKYDDEIKAYSEIETKADSILKTAEKEMVKEDTNLQFQDAYGTQTTMADFKAKQEELKLLQGMDTSNMSDTERQVHARKISEMSTYITQTGKKAAQEWVNAAMRGDIKDSSGNISSSALTVQNEITALQDSIASSTYANISSQSATNGKEIKNLKDQMGVEKSRVESLTEYRQAKINQRNDNANK